ncbi:MAG: MGMT family protein [Blastocatellia bacterium]|nr:MGMT family protein [Blastocatellia bacterium]
MADNVFESVYEWVLRIPAGRVMTYGQISRLIDERLSAQGVGWALKACPHDDRRIPWHRVVNAQGALSTPRISRHTGHLQKDLLLSEGIAFDENDRLDLSAYQWKPEPEAEN